MQSTKEVKEMTNKELINELLSVNEHIEHLGVGNYELNYQAELERELARRGITNITA